MVWVEKVGAVRVGDATDERAVKHLYGLATPAESTRSMIGTLPSKNSLWLILTMKGI